MQTNILHQRRARQSLHCTPGIGVLGSAAQGYITPWNETQDVGTYWFIPGSVTGSPKLAACGAS